MHAVRGNSLAARLLVRVSCVLLCLFLAFPSGAPVAAQPVSEYDVEAAYLYNFGKFVHWPESVQKNASFDICILGDDELRGRISDRACCRMRHRLYL